MENIKGFTAEIYQGSFVDRFSPIKDAKNVTIIDEAVPQMDIPDDEHPAVRIVRRILFGREYIHAEPYENGYYAFGGRFIYSCDSRFRQDLNQYPIPLHDRDMNKEVR